MAGPGNSALPLATLCENELRATPRGAWQHCKGGRGWSIPAAGQGGMGPQKLKLVSLKPARIPRVTLMELRPKPLAIFELRMDESWGSDGARSLPLFLIAVVQMDDSWGSDGARSLPLFSIAGIIPSNIIPLAGQPGG